MSAPAAAPPACTAVVLFAGFALLTEAEAAAALSQAKSHTTNARVRDRARVLATMQLAFPQSIPITLNEDSQPADCEPHQHVEASFGTRAGRTDTPGSLRALLKHHGHPRIVAIFGDYVRNPGVYGAEKCYGAFMLMVPLMLEVGSIDPHTVLYLLANRAIFNDTLKSGMVAHGVAGRLYYYKFELLTAEQNPLFQATDSLVDPKLLWDDSTKATSSGLWSAELNDQLLEQHALGDYPFVRISFTTDSSAAEASRTAFFTVKPMPTFKPPRSANPRHVAQLANLEAFVEDEKARFDLLKYEPWTTASRCAKSMSLHPSRLVPNCTGVFFDPTKVTCATKTNSYRSFLCNYPGLLVYEELYDEFHRLYYCPTAMRVKVLDYVVDAQTAKEMCLNKESLRPDGRFNVRMLIIGDPCAIGPIANSPYGVEGAQVNSRFETCKVADLHKYTSTLKGALKITVDGDLVHSHRSTDVVGSYGTEMLIAYGTDEATERDLFWTRDNSLDAANSYCDRCYGRVALKGDGLFLCDHKVGDHKVCMAGRHVSCHDPGDDSYKQPTWFCDAHLTAPEVKRDLLRLSAPPTSLSHQLNQSATPHTRVGLSLISPVLPMAGQVPRSSTAQAAPSSPLSTLDVLPRQLLRSTLDATVGLWGGPKLNGDPKADKSFGAGSLLNNVYLLSLFRTLPAAAQLLGQEGVGQVSGLIQAARRWVKEPEKEWLFNRLYPTDSPAAADSSAMDIDDGDMWSDLRGALKRLRDAPSTPADCAGHVDAATTALCSLAIGHGPSRAQAQCVAGLSSVLSSLVGSTAADSLLGHLLRRYSADKSAALTELLCALLYFLTHCIFAQTMYHTQMPAVEPFGLQAIAACLHRPDVLAFLQQQQHAELWAECVAIWNVADVGDTQSHADRWAPLDEWRKQKDGRLFQVRLAQSGGWGSVAPLHVLAVLFMAQPTLTRAHAQRYAAARTVAARPSQRFDGVAPSTAAADSASIPASASSSRPMTVTKSGRVTTAARFTDVLRSQNNFPTQLGLPLPPAPHVQQRYEVGRSQLDFNCTQLQLRVAKSGAKPHLGIKDPGRGLFNGVARRLKGSTVAYAFGKFIDDETRINIVRGDDPTYRAGEEDFCGTASSGIFCVFHVPQQESGANQLIASRDCPAAYINHSDDAELVNVKLCTPDVRYEPSEQPNHYTYFQVEAIQDIDPGQELFADYGWADRVWREAKTLMARAAQARNQPAPSAMQRSLSRSLSRMPHSAGGSSSQPAFVASAGRQQTSSVAVRSHTSLGLPPRHPLARLPVLDPAQLPSPVAVDPFDPGDSRWSLDRDCHLLSSDSEDMDSESDSAEVTLSDVDSSDEPSSDDAEATTSSSDDSDKENAPLQAVSVPGIAAKRRVSGLGVAEADQLTVRSRGQYGLSFKRTQRKHGVKFKCSLRDEDKTRMEEVYQLPQFASALKHKSSMFHLTDKIQQRLTSAWDGVNSCCFATLAAQHRPKFESPVALARTRMDFLARFQFDLASIKQVWFDMVSRHTYHVADAPLCDACFFNVMLVPQSTMYRWLAKHTPGVQDTSAQVRPADQRDAVHEQLRILFFDEGQSLPTKEGSSSTLNKRYLSYKTKQACRLAVEEALSTKHGCPTKVSKSTFRLAVSSVEKALGIQLNIKKSKQLAECAECVKLLHAKKVAAASKDKAAQVVAEIEWQGHKKEFREQRRLFESRKLMALRHPHKLNVVTWDGMDTKKTCMPHFAGTPCKHVDVEQGSIPLRVVGAFMFGSIIPCVGIVSYPNVVSKGGDASVTNLEAILDMNYSAMDEKNWAPIPTDEEEAELMAELRLKRPGLVPTVRARMTPKERKLAKMKALEEELPDPLFHRSPRAACAPKASFMWPEALHATFDNTSGDSKNTATFRFLGMLVAIGVYMYITVSTLMVGHTHDIVDQMFSVWSRLLHANDAQTVEQLRRLFREKYGTKIYELERLIANFKSTAGNQGADMADSPPIATRLIELADDFGVQPMVIMQTFTVATTDWCHKVKDRIEDISAPHVFLIWKEWWPEDDNFPLAKGKFVVSLYTNFLAKSATSAVYSHIQGQGMYVTDKMGNPLPMGPWTRRVDLVNMSEVPYVDPLRCGPKLVDKDKYMKCVEARRMLNQIDDGVLAYYEHTLEGFMADSGTLADSCAQCGNFALRTRENGVIRGITPTSTKEEKERHREQQKIKADIKKKKELHFIHVPHAGLKHYGWWTKWVQRVQDVITPYYRRRKLLTELTDSQRETTGRSAHPRHMPMARNDPQLYPKRVDLETEGVREPRVGDIIVVRGNTVFQPFWVGKIVEESAPKSKRKSKQKALVQEAEQAAPAAAAAAAAARPQRHASKRPRYHDDSDEHDAEDVDYEPALDAGEEMQDEEESGADSGMEEEPARSSKSTGPAAKSAGPAAKRARADTALDDLPAAAASAAAAAASAPMDEEPASYPVLWYQVAADYLARVDVLHPESTRKALKDAVAEGTQLSSALELYDRADEALEQGVWHAVPEWLMDRWDPAPWSPVLKGKLKKDELDPRYGVVQRNTLIAWGSQDKMFLKEGKQHKLKAAVLAKVREDVCEVDAAKAAVAVAAAAAPASRMLAAALD